jgi:hypothetical protein
MNSVYRLLDHFVNGSQYLSNVTDDGRLTEELLIEGLIEFAYFLPSEIEEIKDTIKMYVEDKR